MFENRDEETNVILSGLFMTIGITPLFEGFRYIKDAVKRYKEYKGMMGALCESIAQRYGTVRGRVERDIRFAIQCAHIKGSLTNLNEVLDINYIKENECVSNKALVSLIAEYVDNEHFRYNVICRNVKCLNYILVQRQKRIV